MRVTIDPITLKFRRPLRSAWGVLTERQVLMITLKDSDGVSGRGEAAPLRPYDGVALGDVRVALEAYKPVLADADDKLASEVLDECRTIRDLPQALAAVDLALWDRAGRREGKPVAALITDDPAESVPVNATVGALDRSGAAEQAYAAVQEGYSCIKLKVGVGDDPGRVAAVRRAIGPKVALRLDANGAWNPIDAVRMLKEMAPLELEIVEEPCRGLISLREVRERVTVKIALDETGAEPGALNANVADAVCLKITRSGGITALLDDAETAHNSGLDIYLSSTFDGPLGIAAALHCAAAMNTTIPCGLATLALYEGLDGLLAMEDGAIALPTGPGLGFQPQSAPG
jgi:L-Ala-D/L-Glu epimerase